MHMRRHLALGQLIYNRLWLVFLTVIIVAVIPVCYFAYAEDITLNLGDPRNLRVKIYDLISERPYSEDPNDIAAIRKSVNLFLIKSTPESSNGEDKIFLTIEKLYGALSTSNINYAPKFQIVSNVREADVVVFYAASLSGGDLEKEIRLDQIDNGISDNQETQWKALRDLVANKISEAGLALMKECGAFNVTSNNLILKSLIFIPSGLDAVSRNSCAHSGVGFSLGLVGTAGLGDSMVHKLDADIRFEKLDKLALRILYSNDLHRESRTIDIINYYFNSLNLP